MGLLIASAIGSAVSTIVNGGTFASFAIGFGIGLAAGFAAGALTGMDKLSGTALEKFLQDPIKVIANGALAGALSGAASSAVYGQNVWKGMGEGALGGITGTGVGLATEFIVEPMIAVEKWWTGNPATLTVTVDLSKNYELKQALGDTATFEVKIRSAEQWGKFLDDVVSFGENCIKELE